MAPGKRGRLSSIDMLPEEAQPDVAWAIAELGARKRTAESIRLELNERLLALGCDPISSSSFNRYSLFISRHGQAMQQVRGVAALIAERMDEEPSMKMLLAAAEAVQRLELARSTSLKAAAYKREKFIEKAADVAEEVAREKGLGADTVEAIKSAILGVPK